MIHRITSLPADWKAELWLLLGITLAAITADVLSGRLLLCLLSGLIAYLAWHLYHLARLTRLLGDNHAAGAYRPFGLWRTVFRQTGALHAESSQRESSLARLQNRFQDALSALSEAVVILEQNGKIDWINPAAGRLLGIDGPGSSGQVFTDIVRDPILEEYLDGGAFDQPLVFSPVTNRAKILSLYVIPTGSHRQQMIVASDISRQYHLDTVLQDFVANISHELRTPLTVITGLLEQLHNANSRSSPDRRAFELMQNQAVRMSELIADLLTLSRLELNKRPPARDVIDMPELLATITEEARSFSQSSGHVVVLSIESTGHLRGDRKELRTAISNLVTNAVQHTPNRTEVRIRWRVDEAGAHLSVSDSGEGIAARHLPRLTERLYRVDASRSRATGGTGLGLAIVKYILERHDAELEISSTVGHGSSFICHFPIASAIRQEAVRDAHIPD